MTPLQTFQSLIGVNFKDEKLLERAFIHRSYLNEHPSLGLEHNERLEFLGDAVLELVVTDFLYRNYPNPEGDLTNWRSALVKTESLAAVAQKLEIAQYFRLSRGESKGNARSHALISANAVEAVIGAIYLDQGYEQAKAFIDEHIVSRLPEILESGAWMDAKSKFQELERKQLLRLRGQPYCRICQLAEIGQPDPPFSDDERIFHRTNHGEAMQNVPRPRNWPDVERIDAEQKRRAGR